MPAQWKTRAQRLARMSWPEFHDRARQELGKRWEGYLARAGCLPAAETPRWKKETQGSEPRFFFTFDELPRLVELLRRRFPDETEKTIEQAEQICAHRFDLLGYRGLDYGQAIDWQLDRVNGKRAPHKLAYQIRYLDFDQVGDVKVTWELNRHQHFLTLGKAYRLTGKEYYAREFVAQFYDWQEKNPYPWGINWASSLEMGFRCLSWLWAAHLFAGSSALPQSFQRTLRQGLARHARSIERYLSTYSSPNTHLLGEATALFFVGTLCPELPSAARWREQGWEILQQENARQIHNDGGYREPSTYYHVYALDFFLHARTLAAHNRLDIPPAFDRRLEKMLEHLRMLAIAGPPPRRGDDDGGRVFDPRRNRPQHMTDPLSTGAVLFQRPELKAAAGELREETLWLLGPEAAQAFAALPETAPVVRSAAFADSGVYVLAHRDARLTVDAGTGNGYPGGHRHAGALGVVLAVGGQEWLSDPGTLVYSSPGKERNAYRGTAAHNTVRVDGLDQADTRGPFQWERLPEVEVDRWTAGESFDLFIGRHDGYRRLPDPVTHRRTVFFRKPGFWLVVDEAQGSGRHKLELFWNLPAGELSQEPGGALRSRLGEKSLHLLTADDIPWAREESTTWSSPCYGAQEPMRTVHFVTDTTLPARFATLVLAPTDVPAAGRFQTIPGKQQGDVCGYQYETESQRHTMLLAGVDTPWECGRWASDAEFVYWEETTAGEPRHLILCGGTFLQRDGEKLVDSPHTCERLECRWGPEGWEILAGERDALCKTGSAAGAAGSVSMRVAGV